MFEFFDKVIGFFELIWQFIENLVKGLLLAISVLSQALTLPVVFSTLLPAVIFSSMLIVFSFAIVKFILGR